MTEVRVHAGLAAVLKMLSDAAEREREAPYNTVIADRLGFASIATASGYVTRLEKMGLIRVERFRSGREVTIVATGKRTLWRGDRTPHFRVAGKAPRPATPRIVDPAAPTPEETMAARPRVDRDPCFKCGTRRDVGCRHHPKGA